MTIETQHSDLFRQLSDLFLSPLLPVLVLVLSMAPKYNYRGQGEDRAPSLGCAAVNSKGKTQNITVTTPVNTRNFLIIKIFYRLCPLGWSSDIDRMITVYEVYT